jgi:predicted DsbA family dithiol-disulfide isomerase
MPEAHSSQPQIRWHPFNLDPTLTKSVDKREMYATKFGPERAEAMHKMMAQRGKDEGINFAFGGMRGPTLDSHRLIDLAYDEGGESLQNTLVESLFKAYFEEEKDLADRAVLVDRAKASGMNADKVKAFLDSDERKGKIEQEIADANKREVYGVPHFIFNGRYGECLKLLRPCLTRSYPQSRSIRSAKCGDLPSCYAGGMLI